jgi:hypothetical protein
MKDLSQSAIALIQISDRSKENALRIVKVKKGIVHIIDPLLVLAPIMMDIFQELRVNRKLFFAFLMHSRVDFKWFAIRPFETIFSS